MAIETHLFSKGAWRKASDVYVKVNGAWVSMKEVWTKSNGKWRLVFIKGFFFNDVVSGYNYNLRNKALAAGWDGVLPLYATLTVSGTVGCTYNNSAYYDWVDYTIRYGKKVGGGTLTVADIIADLNALAPRTIYFTETKSLNLPQNGTTPLGYPIIAAMYHWQVYGQSNGYTLNTIPAVPSFDTGQLTDGSTVVMTLPTGTAILGSGGGTGGLPTNLDAYSGTPGSSGAGGGGPITDPGGFVGLYPTLPGGAGGCAINAQYPITIINNGIIGGGGGGGAGGPPVTHNWGGGGGGGAGHCSQMSGGIYTSDTQASFLGNSVSIPITTGNLMLVMPTIVPVFVAGVSNQGPLVAVVDVSNSANYLQGTITALDWTTGNTVINITTAHGSGTITNWEIAPTTTTTLAISTGTKAFAGASYFYNQGMQVTLRDITNSANFMSGTIVSTSTYGDQLPSQPSGNGLFNANTNTYVPANITFNCTSTGGSGTISLWSVITNAIGIGGLGAQGWVSTSGSGGFGQNGLSLTGGNGGVGYYSVVAPADWQNAAPGGKGGDLAQPGQATIVQGGAPGPAATGSSNITWQVYGTIIGQLL